MVRRESLAEQVAAELRAMVGDRFEPGQQLPTEKDLAAKLGVSRNTLREALGILWNEGLVVRRWGVGTFVRDEGEPVVLSLTDAIPTRDVIRAAGHEPVLSHVKIDRVDPGETMARMLGVEAGASVWRVERMFAVDDLPAVFLVDHVPVELNGRVIDPSPLKDVNYDMFALLRDAAHCRVERIDTTLEAIAAEGKVADHLQVPQAAPLIRSVQVASARDGRVVLHGENYNRTDVVTLRLIRRVRV